MAIALMLPLNGLASTDGFALLDIQDAAWLRQHGWKGRILLLDGFFHENDLSLAEELVCDLVVYCEAQVEWLERFKVKNHKPISCLSQNEYRHESFGVQARCLQKGISPFACCWLSHAPHDSFC